MKIYQKTATFIFLLCMVCTNIESFAQENKDTETEITPILELIYTSTSDDSIILNANISVRRETGFFALENTEIEFSMSDGNIQENIGISKAGSDGSAILKVQVKSGILMDKEGKTTYAANFSGKGKYLTTSTSITVKLAKIQLSFSATDTIRKILVNVTQKEANGEIKPVPKEKVILYVPRMLSDLKIGEIELDENGTGSTEFSDKLVGDSLGNLVVIAKIEENQEYGNVTGKSSVSWGVPKQYYLAERPVRELWTPIAPIWMIVTLIIMLAGVWGHYIFAVAQLIIIKWKSRHQKK